MPAPSPSRPDNGQCVSLSQPRRIVPICTGLETCPVTGFEMATATVTSANNRYCKDAEPDPSRDGIRYSAPPCRFGAAGSWADYLGDCTRIIQIWPHHCRLLHTEGGFPGRRRVLEAGAAAHRSVGMRHGILRCPQRSGALRARLRVFAPSADGRADPPPGRGGGAPASRSWSRNSDTAVAAERAGACEDHQGSRNSFVRCCRSLSVLRTGGGQPLVEPDGLVSVGTPRGE